MRKPDAVGHDEVSGRDLFVVDAGSLDDAIWPLPSASKYFVCLLAWDATSASDAEIATLAQRLLASGCVYILCWGSDCERVHDIFDAEEARQRPDGPFAISIWHTDQMLADVLWDSLFTAFPDDAYRESVDPQSALRYGRRTGPPKTDRPSWILVPSARATWMRKLANRPLERAGMQARVDVPCTSAGRSAPGR